MTLKKISRFEKNKQAVEKATWKFEENINEELYKKKYSFVFTHKELDFIITVLEALERDDRSEVTAFRERLEKKITHFNFESSTLRDRLLCSPEVEKK